MGNAGQASEEARRVAECIADGAIGAVTEVHDWTDRPIWPQGMGRPLETPPVPDVLDWDLWLGPAPVRPYHPAYVSVRWRGWIDFGTGALGDIGCHDCHPIFKALHLGHPLSVEASWSQPVGSDLKKIGVDESFPVASVVRYEFPARDGMPPVVLHWYDGGIKPSRPEELESGREWRSEGTLYVGDRGKMLDGRIIPETRMQEYTPPPKTLPRSPGHFEEWIRAIQGGEPAGANFDFASMVTEVVLLGNIAIRTGKKLLWDGPNMKITNDEAANAYLQRTYREGWTL
jgi:predicted dehydrogenase